MRQTLHWSQMLGRALVGVSVVMELTTGVLYLQGLKHLGILVAAGAFIFLLGGILEATGRNILRLDKSSGRGKL